MSLFNRFLAFSMGDVTYKIFGAALIGVFLLIVIRKGNADGALSARMVIGIVLAVGCVILSTPVIDFVRELTDVLGKDGEIYVETLLKALGICVVTHVCATVCRDSGEGSVAGYVELGGKIEIIILSLPLIREIISSSLELLEMK